MLLALRRGAFSRGIFPQRNDLYSAHKQLAWLSRRSIRRVSGRNVPDTHTHTHTHTHTCAVSLYVYVLLSGWS
jgi:hypothetical protein